jgi:predicted HAD superfamily Cof-like phosphohydrolase
MSDGLLETTAQWFVAANQQPAVPEPNIPQIGFYMGMQLEELGEKVAVISPMDGEWLKSLGKAYKNGMFNGTIADKLRDPANAKELLDGDVDLLWVSIGGARAQGADVLGAFGAVSEANWKKRWADGEFHNDPTTNKVLKPEGWQAPDLTSFIHPSLRQEGTTAP